MRDEQGSTLLVVLASVLILTVMMTGLYSVSIRSLDETSQYDNATIALTNARSGIQAVYNQIGIKWNAYAKSGFSSIGDAESHLAQVASDVNAFSWPGQVFTVSVQAPNDSEHNDFLQANQSGSNVSTLYQNYTVTVTGVSNGIERTLSDTFTISGTIDALNYALYTPGNLFVCGAPEIDGRVAVGGATFFDPTSWEGWVLGYSGQSYLSFEGSSLEFYSERPSDEPSVLPSFGNGAILASSAGIFSFTQFTDQKYNNSGTYLFGDASKIADKSAITTSPGGTNPISNYAIGLTGNSTPHMVLPANYVAQIITNNQSTDPASNSVLVQAKQLGTYSAQWLKNYPNMLPASGGYIDLSGGQLSLNGTFTVNGATYVNGNLTIPSGTVLNMNKPLFVAGNLTINGILNSNAAIFVSGSTTITNVPPDIQGQSPSRLELYSLGNIELTLLNNGQNGTAQSPTTFDTFLASNEDIYLEGMDSYYHIIGGVAGKDLILDSTVGNKQTTTSSNTLRNYGVSTDPGYLSRRLVITYDPSYVINPLVGTPTVNDLVLQPLPSPILKS